MNPSWGLRHRKRGPWIWRCHLDLSHPHEKLWQYLTPLIEQYDAVILTLREYAQKLQTPQLFFLPALDPFLIKSRTLSDEELNTRLEHYAIPADLPLTASYASAWDRRHEKPCGHDFS